MNAYQKELDRLNEMLYMRGVSHLCEVNFADTAIALFREPKRELKEFTIKGHKVMAYSKKDAIKRLKHQKKI